LPRSLRAELISTHYGEEIWALYQRGKLQPDPVLTGAFEFDDRAADVAAVQMSIDDVRQEAMIRQQGREAAERLIRERQ
jgi:RIO kinase 1